MTARPWRPVGPTAGADGRGDAAVAQEAPWAAIAAAALVWTAALAVVNAFGFRGEIRAALDALQAATGGLVAPTLVGSAAVLLVFLAGVTVLGRVSLASVGWSRGAAARAIAPVLGFWLLLQGALVLRAAMVGDLAWHPAWERLGAGTVIGGVLAQVFGNALAEETVFRGFFFTQFRRKARTLPPLAAFGAAAVASAGLFAVSHLPNRFFVKDLPAAMLLADQAQLFFAGIVFAAAFAVTRNVFTTAGLHALANAPAPLVAVPAATISGTYLALLTVGLGAWYVARRLDRSGARPGPGAGAREQGPGHGAGATGRHGSVAR